MSNEIVNLRANEGGALLGTAEVSAEQFDVLLPKLLSVKGRLFRFSSGTFAFGGEVPAEYVEVVPVEVISFTPANG